jgi:hypothetical protein
LMVPVLVPVFEVPTVPFQPSDPVPPAAAQEVAPLLVQASEAACPVGIVEGVALKLLTVAAGGGGVTLMLIEFAPLAPPGPLQFRVYV